MKKFLVLLLTIVLTLSLSACYAVEEVEDVIDPIKLSDAKRCADCTIATSASTYVITPSGFDLEKLNKRGYKMRITVTYTVSYTKTWDVLWDIGYLGAPKYEVCILDDDLVGKLDADITAPSSSKTRSIYYSTDVVNLIGSKIYLTFSSDNIQNKIHFKNISVKYDCYK